MIEHQPQEPIGPSAVQAARSRTATIFLCGDVMTGRGVDQILPRPSSPALYEPVVRSALEYVAIAERAHGAIPRAVDHGYVWGVALEELDWRRPVARIINLETSVTTSDAPEPKRINYRMHPANVPVLTAAHIDCAVLANNHVIDWGTVGLCETLDVLARAGVRVAGAGRTLAEARAPAILQTAVGRVLVFGFGAIDSGVPRSWSATTDGPGVHLLTDYSRRSVEHIARLVGSTKGVGDIAVASIHWGGNWGYDIPDDHRRFAHELIEHAAVDVVHGHSSHHPKAIEVHHRRPIFYGCGDFLNDYEGIHAPEDFRDDLTLMYFPTLDARTGEMMRLEMVPLLIRNFRLQHPPASDAEWLSRALERECRRFGHRVVRHGGSIELEWT